MGITENLTYKIANFFALSTTTGSSECVKLASAAAMQESHTNRLFCQSFWVLPLEL